MRLQQHIQRQARRQLQAHHYPGSVQVASARHVGFSRGGIDATLIYQEQVGKHPVRVTLPVSMGDDGHLNLSADDRQPLQTVSSQRDNNRRVTRQVRHAFNSIATSTLSAESAVVTLDTPNDWLTQRLQQNRQGHATSAYNGYYALTTTDLLQHNAAHYTVDYVYHAKRDRQSNERSGQHALTRALNQLKAHDLPNGKYAVGFMIQTPSGRTGMLSDTKFLFVQHGRVTATHDYDDNLPEISQWTPATS